MSEMVERLLPILIEATSGFSCGSMDYEGTLRRLIAAMREPTEAMRALDASLAPTWDHSTAPPTLRHRLMSHTGASYQAMIDEALK